jgi:hypothetical protein
MSVAQHPPVSGLPFPFDPCTVSWRPQSPCQKPWKCAARPNVDTLQPRSLFWRLTSAAGSPSCKTAGSKQESGPWYLGSRP